MWLDGRTWATSTSYHYMNINEQREATMLKRITSLFRPEQEEDAVAGSAERKQLAPERPFVAIGDIHGCDSQLADVLEQIDAAIEASEPRVFLGDYVDRGPQSKQVLTLLFELNQQAPERAICLKGNHEQMMLDFIDDPAGNGQLWLQHGGLQTLASFGIALRQTRMDSTSWVDVAHRIESALPAGMESWLRQLPLRWSSGNVHCVHAAMSPQRAVNDQRDEVLLWGHQDFMNKPRGDDNFVVHGHTIVRRARVFANRVSLDTGVYRTGRLSAARISAGQCRFFETEISPKTRTSLRKRA